MTLKEYWEAIASRPGKERFAFEAGTTYAYVTQITGGHRQAGATLAVALHKASGFQISLNSMRADIYPDPEYTLDPIK